MKATTKRVSLIAAAALASVVALSLGVSGIFASASTATESTLLGQNGYFYTDFTSREDAYAAAEELNAQLEGEGIVMLKNDGSLPLKKGLKVSVLGIAQDMLVESSGTITDSLRNAGFSVNPTLENKYLSDGLDDTATGNETPLTSSEKKSLGYYNDVGVVVLNRGTEGESLDMSVNTGEVDDGTYLGNESGWRHENHNDYASVTEYYYIDDSGVEHVIDTSDERYNAIQHTWTENGVDYAVDTREVVSGVGEGTEYKHALQLTDSEEELVRVAEENCKKVIVLYSAATTFEFANLQDDKNINAILWVGRPGDGGVDAIGQVINGEINPSGGVVDEWTRDFTNDPTYANVNVSPFYDTNGDPAATGEVPDYVYGQIGGNSDNETDMMGIDYEEDIYLGYRFYETYWAEAKANSSSASPSIIGTDGSYATTTADEWYSYNVVYPFGYGLSYTDFSFSLSKVYSNYSSSDIGTSLAASDIESTADDGMAKITTLYADVVVTNTGSVAGKDTVQAYVEAPYYTGETEKSYLKLVGFAKTDLLDPGESQTVTVEFNVQDLASYDYSDANNDGHTGYELDQGSYTLHFMESSSHENITSDTAAPYASKTFTIGTISDSATSSEGYAAVKLDLDDYTGNVIENEFSGSDNDPLTDDEWKDDFDTLILANDENNTCYTSLTRANFNGTMPEAPDEGRKLSAETIHVYAKYEYVTADVTDDEGNLVWSDEGMPWYVDYDEIPDTWTQGTGVIGANGMYDITLADMAGVPLYDSYGNISEQWNTFMNQLTWDEIGYLMTNGFHTTLALETIGKLQTKDENGPNITFSSEDGVQWVCEATVAATFNTELAHEEGRLYGDCALLYENQGSTSAFETGSTDMTVSAGTGWYGPGLNTQRNPFAGRVPEYYSQDGILSGYIGAAASKGATEMGIMVYVKHFACYDIQNAYGYSSVSISEQNIRENYLKPFQMAMQEGGAQATMSSVNRIGAIFVGQNYALVQKVLRDEWGWTGVLLTDIYFAVSNMTLDMLTRAGGTFCDGDISSRDYMLLSGEWEDSVTYTDPTTGEEVTRANGGITLNGIYSPTQWYSGRMGATYLLYNCANSAANFNGITERTLDLTVNMTQGVSNSSALLDENVYGTAAGHEITSSYIMGGTLPDGLTLSGNTLSGTVNDAEGGSFVVRLFVDGWISVDVTVTVEVTPVVLFEEDISSLTTGTSVDCAVYMDGTTDYTVSIVSGSLPDGLKMDAEGIITGTAQTSGTYSFTVALTYDGETYTRNYTIVVTGEDIVMKGIDSMSINSDGELVVSYTDGTSQNLGTVVGADGKDGEDGSGCGSAVDLAGTVIALAFVLAAAGVVYAIARRNRKHASDGE